MKERLIGSIPPRTTLDMLREQERGIRLGFGGNYPLGNSVSIGRLTPESSWQQSPKQEPGSFNVKDHIFQKPAPEKPTESLISPEDERISWQIEVHEGLKAREDSNGAGDLGLIIQFSGIKFMTPPIFNEGRRNYGPDTRVFYTPVDYKNGRAFLILGTFGDIFESQVVPKEKDVNPFFQEEIYWPSLLTLYDPKSMRPFYNNGLVVVSYAPLQSGELSKILA